MAYFEILNPSKRDNIGNIMGENASYQHSLISSQCFQKPLYLSIMLYHLMFLYRRDIFLYYCIPDACNQFICSQ